MVTPPGAPEETHRTQAVEVGEVLGLRAARKRRCHSHEGIGNTQSKGAVLAAKAVETHKVKAVPHRMADLRRRGPTFAFVLLGPHDRRGDLPLALEHFAAPEGGEKAVEGRGKAVKRHWEVKEGQ